MPNRILKESICSSENIDQLSPMAEIAFYRLIVNCDDYGRMDGRVKIIKSRLFPLKDITNDEMLSMLSELERAELIQAYVVDGKPYLQMKTWENHQQVRNHKSKYPSPDEDNCDQLQSIDINCNQLISNDSKCPRNPIQSNPYPNPNPVSVSESELSDDDAHEIQSEQNRVLDAAVDAGFQQSNTVRAKLIALYAENGLDRMLNAINECVTHGAVNLAYLQAVLRGGPRKEKPKVNAQDFQQRDYSDVNGKLMDDLAAEIAEFERREVSG